MTTNNVYDHEAVIHGFVRKALRYAGDEADFDEREQLEEELPEYAETIANGGGYDLDQRIATLQAENERLAQRLKIAEEVEIHLSDKLQDARQFQKNQKEVNALLARDCKKAEAENERLRAALLEIRTQLEPYTPDTAYYIIQQAAALSQRALGEE